MPLSMSTDGLYRESKMGYMSPVNWVTPREARPAQCVCMRVALTMTGSNIDTRRD
jgi:hypothetical protein